MVQWCSDDMIPQELIDILSEDTECYALDSDIEKEMDVVVKSLMDQIFESDDDTVDEENDSVN